MSYRVTLLRGYQQDFKQAYQWYEEQRPGLGRQFRLAASERIKQLRHNPYIFSRFEEDIRHVVLRRFPYGMFYTVRDAEVIVVSIQHLHRDPEYIITQIVQRT